MVLWDLFAKQDYHALHHYPFFYQFQLAETKVIARQSNKRKYEITGTPVHTSRGKVIGQVIGDVFVKDITTRHILDKFNALASDICTLHEAEHAGACYVEFTNTDDGIIYRANISKFWEQGFFIDFGFGKQQALNLSHFEHRRDPNHESQSDTVTPAYSEDGTTNTMPLTYKSHAVTGSQFTKTGKKTLKQMRMFGNGGHYG
jgi:hypothetical protein